MPPRTADPVVANYRRLTATQQHLIGDVIRRLREPVRVTQFVTAPPFDPDFFRVFGETLQIHHALSSRHLSKDSFEFALKRSVELTGRNAKYGPRARAAHDVEIDGEKFSLKTQADQGISRNIIHISKFMELGTGEWTDAISLGVLRDSFLKHLAAYDRIVTLRYFRTPDDRDLSATSHRYELIEIPKSLLQESRGKPITLSARSKHDTKPGLCKVLDSDGKSVRFSLYFDGGKECKLQITSLRKLLCIPIGEWEFDA